MDATTNPIPTLTSAEVRILERFKEVLKNPGVKAVLMMAFATAGSNHSQVSTRVLSLYLSDVGKTESHDMHEAGVSLQEVVDLAQETGIFPEDFLPPQETVDKCVDGFWAMHR